MKKSKLLFMSLALSFALAACKGNGDTPSTNVPSVEPTIDANLDDNGTNGVDEDKRIDPANDPNQIDGLDYTYEGDWGHNKDYKKPGLYNKDGSIHTLPEENKETGRKINVIMFGAKADDKTFDNTKAVKSALASAKEGDYIYFPAGKFYFSTKTLSKPFYSHIYVYTSGVNIVGAGKDKTFLVSNFTEEENLGKKTATIAIVNAKNVVVRDLAFTAEVPDDVMPNDLSTGRNNKEGNKYAPNTHIAVMNADPSDVTSNIVVKNCHISYFQVNAILFHQTIDCTAYNNVIEKATDLGGGGHGYGIQVRGGGFETFGMIDTNMDSRYNYIHHNKVMGPFIRHSIILSYVSHNNLVANNEIQGSQDEPLDLHGEDEFLNVITKNTVKNVTRSAIGLGNPGSTHDATGPGNIIYGNNVDGANGGIQVSYGTPDTQIYNNTIKCKGAGIDIIHGPNSVIRNNNIALSGDDSFGIRVGYSYVWDKPENGVSKVDIQSNTITGAKKGMSFEVYKDGSKIKNNTFENCAENIISTKDSFKIPEKSTFFDEVKGETVYSTQEGNINRGSYNINVNNHGYYWFKGSHEEPGYNRMIYQEFDIDRNVLASSSKVYLRLTTTSKSAKQHYFIWGVEDLEWDPDKLTWGNAPYVNNPVNNKELPLDPTGEYSVEKYPYECKLYDPNKDCKLITDFECVVVNDAFLTYYIDVTDYFKNELKGSNVTMIFTNETMDAAYSSVRNKNGNPESVWPCLIFANES